MNLTQVEERQKRGKYYNAWMLAELMLINISHQCGEVALLADNPRLCQRCQEWYREGRSAMPSDRTGGPALKVAARLALRGLRISQ